METITSEETGLLVTEALTKLLDSGLAEDLELSPGLILGELLAHSVSSEVHSDPHLAQFVQRSIQSAHRQSGQVRLVLG